MKVIGETDLPKGPSVKYLRQKQHGAQSLMRGDINMEILGEELKYSARR